MFFEVIGEITDVERIAVRSGIRDVERLRKSYGRGRWRKLKGFALVRLEDGTNAMLNYTGMRRMELEKGK